MHISGEDVECAGAALDYLLHPNSLLQESRDRDGVSSPLHGAPGYERERANASDVQIKTTHHKLLLGASHGGASLGVLVSPHEQLDQSGDGTLLAQRCVIGWTKRQVTD